MRGCGALLLELNFQNKVSLLHASKLSPNGKDSEAEAAYNASITAAQSSKLIHKESLATELDFNP